MLKKMFDFLQKNETKTHVEEKENIKTYKNKFHDVIAELDSVNNLQELAKKVEKYKDLINEQYKTSYANNANNKDLALDNNQSFYVPQLEFCSTNNFNLINKYSFIPFAELSILSQVPLIYNASDTYAKEMQRAGYEFVAIKQTEKDEEIIKLLQEEFKKFNIDKLMFNLNLKLVYYLLLLLSNLISI